MQRTSSTSRRRSSTRSSRRSSKSNTDSLAALRKQYEDVKPMLDNAWESAAPVLATIWGFSALIWTFLLGWSAQKAVLVVDSYKEKKDQMNKRTKVLTLGNIFHSTASALLISANPFWHRKVEYEVPLEQLPSKCVYMVNHISFADPFVLCGVVPESKSAGQGVLFNLPIVGGVLENNGDMAVHFEKKENGKWGTKEGTAAELLQTAEDYIRDDVPVAVFPEGTITKDGELKPFKPGFFKVAIATGAPIVPIAMWGNQELWPMQLGKKDVSTPAPYLGTGTVHIRVGAPIPSDDMTVEELMDVTRTKMEQMLHALPNYSIDKYYK